MRRDPETRTAPFDACNLQGTYAPEGVPIYGVDRAYVPESTNVSLAGKTEAEARILCCRNMTKVIKHQASKLNLTMAEAM